MRGGAWLVALALVVACGEGATRRFPVREPLTVDPDRHPFSPKPEAQWLSFFWEGGDQALFRPLSKTLSPRPKREATNVNAFDEVPRSSWFTPRIGKGPLSPERLARGSCETAPLDMSSAPWRIISGKHAGANPGFVIETAHGARYLLKLDSPHQPERSTTAEVVGALLYWGAGYSVPCNRIVFFPDSVLQLTREATVTDRLGRESPLTWSHVEAVLAHGVRRRDGWYRALASRFLPGEPLGPWRYDGTWEPDVNDVVPHEDRRELRANYVLASWINHFDVRDENTLATWIEVGDGLGYVRHNYIDFGDSLGSLWAVEGMSERLGYAHYFEAETILVDAFTLGLIRRPWDVSNYGPGGQVFGYFGVDRFEPDAWRPGLPNAAFERMTERDAAWMARIVVRFRDAHLRAVVEQARLRDPELGRVLLYILAERRDRIGRRWLRRISPLTDPWVERGGGDRQWLCLWDLARIAGLVSPQARRYLTSAWRGKAMRPVRLGPLHTDPARGRVCVALPANRSDADSVADASYLIVDVTGLASAEDTRAAPARAHLVQRRDGYRLVGLERPYDRDAPAPLAPR